MTLESVFQIANITATIGWVLVTVSLFVTGPRFFRIIVYGTAVPLVLAAAYLVTLTLAMREGGGGGFSTFRDVQTLFENPTALLAGWIHYLAFDLFVGTWIAANSRRTNVPRYLVIPCLFFTFMFGPIGFLSYIVIRGILRRELDSLGNA